MTGPEHYRRAETLIGRAFTADLSDLAGLLAEAQVHATLAAAAATALMAHDDRAYADASEWRQAAGAEGSAP